MFAYFRGWKRKVGLVTLLMSCLFAVGWVRSRTKNDIVIRQNEEVRDSLISNGGNLMFFRIPPLVVDPVRFRLFGDNYFWASVEISTLSRMSFDDVQANWNWNWAGFKVLSGQRAIRGRQEFIYHFSAPYWSIVLPLTALSAWLLLSKRRQPTNPEPSQESEA